MSALGLAKVNFDYDLQGAERCYLDALASDPQEPYAWAMLSGVQVYLDKCEEARRSAMRAVELSPLDPSMYLFKTYVALSELSCGQYDDAMDSAKAALRLNGQHLSAHRLLVMALSLAGRGAEARVAAARYCALDPDARVSYLERRYPGRDSSTAPRFAQALRAAGVPE